MAARRSLRGYKRLPGSAHRYLTPSGKNISEWEYRNRKAKRAGYKNAYQQRQFRSSKDFRSWRFKALSLDQSADVGAGSDIELAVRELDNLRSIGDDDTLYGPDGPLSTLLIAIGARRADWEWAVGDTPKGVRA